MKKNMMDERFMLNKEPVGDVLEILSGAEVVEFTTMAATESRRKYGVTAQSIAGLNCAVERDGLGNFYVDAESLVPILIRAVQELIAKNEKPPRTRAKRADSQE